MYTLPVTPNQPKGGASALPQFYHKDVFDSLVRLCYTGVGHNLITRVFTFQLK